MTSASAACVVAVLLLAAAGSGGRDQQAADATKFDDSFAVFAAHFVGERDERGQAWAHLTYRRGVGKTQRSDSTIDYVRVGQGSGRAMLVRERETKPGYSLDVLHEPGSDRDLVLVGDRYRQPGPGRVPGPLVTTPWVSRPAKAPGRWSPCTSTATRAFCSWEQALRRTQAALPQLPRWVRDDPDGTRTAITGVRLIDLLATGFDPYNDTQLAELAPLFQRLVPLHITTDADGGFLRARITAQLNGPGVQTRLDLGLEHTGDAGPNDIPRGPTDLTQVTGMDFLRYSRFAAAADDRATSPPG